MGLREQVRRQRFLNDLWHLSQLSAEPEPNGTTPNTDKTIFISIVIDNKNNNSRNDCRLRARWTELPFGVAGTECVQVGTSTAMCSHSMWPPLNDNHFALELRTGRPLHMLSMIQRYLANGSGNSHYCWTNNFDVILSSKFEVCAQKVLIRTFSFGFPDTTQYASEQIKFCQSSWAFDTAFRIYSTAQDPSPSLYRRVCSLCVTSQIYLIILGKWCGIKIENQTETFGTGWTAAPQHTQHRHTGTYSFDFHKQNLSVALVGLAHACQLYLLVSFCKY